MVEKKALQRVRVFAPLLQLLQRVNPRVLCRFGKQEVNMLGHDLRSCKCRV
jgi:hypothetical protein